MGRIASLVVIVWAATTAAAEAQPKAESTRLFEEGRELAKTGKFAEACEAFGKSLALDRAPGTALNYGDCLEHLGQLRKAWQMYDEAARAFDKAADSRAAFARDRAAAVTPKLGTLTVKVADPTLAGMVIKLGAESVPVQAQIVERFEPGSLEISASAPGRTPFASAARIAAGANVIVEVPALAVAFGQSDVVVPPPPRPEQPRVGDGRRDPGRVRLAIGLGAAGGVALVASGVLALSARSTYHDALDNDCTHDAMDRLVCSEAGADAVDSAATRANIATGLVIGGSALAIAGVVLFVTAPRETLIAPTATATSVGLVIGRSF